MYFNYLIVDGYAINNADGYTFYMPWTDVKQVGAYSFSFTFTGTPSGTLTLQCSNESDLASPYGNIIGTQSAGGVNALGAQPQNNGLDAVTITGTSTTISSAGNTIIDVALPGHRWVRPVYIGSSGNGAVTIWFNGKKL